MSNQLKVNKKHKHSKPYGCKVVDLVAYTKLRNLVNYSGT